MSVLSEKLARGEFVVTTEIAPPKGCDLTHLMTLAKTLSGIDALNVTDNQGACMRMAPLAVAHLLVESGLEPVLQMTCRDRSRMALQSDLLAAAALGIENLLLLTGDHPQIGDHVDAKPVFDLDSVQLIQTADLLQRGYDLAGNRLSSAPHFFVGAATVPSAQPRSLVLAKAQKKIACGTQFFQTQAVFCRDDLLQYMEAVRATGVPVILGVLLLKSSRMVNFLNSRIPGVQVPEELARRMELAENPLAEGIEIAREAVSWARDLCQGVHLMTLGQEELIPAILS